MPELPRVTLPRRGISNALTFGDHKGELCPPSAMLNAVLYTPHKDRPQLGKRWGMQKVFNTRLAGGAPIQALGVIPRASVISGFAVGSCTAITGLNHLAAALEGQVWMLEKNPQMFRQIYVDVQPTGPFGSTFNGPATNGVQACAWIEGVEALAVATNYNDSVLAIDVSLLVLYDKSGNILDYSLVGQNFTNTMAASPEAANGHRYLAVCAAGHVRVYDVSAGSLQESVLIHLGQWSQESIECGWYLNEGVLELYVGFDGSSNGGTLPNDPAGDITPGKFARHFRAGVIKFVVGGATPLSVTQEIWSQQFANTSTYYEALHGYFRVSEKTSGRPWGCRVTCLDVNQQNGSIAIGRTNQGWGPRATFQPNGSAPYVTLMVIAPNGIPLYETEHNIIREVGDGGFINDIPYGADPTPDTAIMAIRWDEQNDIYMGGRVGDGGSSLFKIDAATGTEIWRYDSGGTIRQAGIRIDPTDNNPIIAFDRNASWTGHAGAQAHLLKLNSADGSVIWSYDLGAAVSALNVDIDRLTGDIFYTTDKV